MRSIYLNEEIISQYFWGALNSFIDNNPNVHNSIEEIVTITEQIRLLFPPGVAGSITRRSSLELFAIAKYFAPISVCEVGTYIGRSTLCIAEGAGSSLKEINTCDFSFDTFNLSADNLAIHTNFSKIKYHPKTSSTEMLKIFLEKNSNQKVDFFFIDGRLSKDDLNYISELKSDDAVFILDDFEGVEKGVANSLLLSQHFKGYVLIRPSITFVNGSFSIGKIALLVPIKLFRITRQQLVPYWM